MADVVLHVNVPTDLCNSLEGKKQYPAPEKKNQDSNPFDFKIPLAMLLSYFLGIFPEGVTLPP